jgi:hypothetical protein
MNWNGFVTELRYWPPVICLLRGLKETMRDLGQDSWCSGQDLNRVPLKYESNCYTSLLDALGGANVVLAS